MKDPLRLVYIIGTYPLLSTTFIDREIKTLRQLGVDLQILAVRPPDSNSPLSTEQQEGLQEGIIYLLPVKWLNFIISHIYFATLYPLSYFNTLIHLITRPHPQGQARYLTHRFMTFLHFLEGVYAAYLLRGRLINQLHAHFVDRAALIALVASRLLNIPYSLTAHANDIYVKPVLLREKILGAKFVTTCTKYNKIYLAQMVGNELNGKLQLAYHGLDTAKYQPAPLSSQSKQSFLLSVGRLTEKKGFFYLVAACRCLKDQGYHFTCHIVGEGPMRRELEIQIIRLGMEDTITLCGAMPQEAVLDKYEQATLFVLPCITAKNGDRDGIPNVLIEAMAMQLPVVSTRHSGIPELVEDGFNGFLVPTNNEVALTEAIAKLLDNPDLCIQFGQRGRAKVLEHFDVERNVRQLYNSFIA